MVSPAEQPRSGHYVAATYELNDTLETGLFKLTLADSFTILEPLRLGAQPLALITGKDKFSIIGRITGAYQAL